MNLHFARPHRLDGVAGVTFLLSVTVFAGTPSDSSRLAWRNVPGASKAHLRMIHMFDSSNGVALGRNLLRFNGRSWSAFQPQPPLQEVAQAFVRSPNRIWVTQTLESSESKIYSYNGIEWKELASPFANQVFAMHLLPDGTGWIGGWGEISSYDGHRWHTLPPPPSHQPIEQLVGDKTQTLWARTSDSRLFYFDRHYWYPQLPEDTIRDIAFVHTGFGFALGMKGPYEFSNAHWKLLSSPPEVFDATTMGIGPRQDLWLIGKQGLILHYAAGSWERMACPTKRNLQDIYFVDGTHAWIVGQGGTVLEYSTHQRRLSGSPRGGFDLIHIYPYGREASDEYGVAMDDINGDGFKDIYAVCIFDPNRMYVNSGRFSHSGAIAPVQFKEEAALRGVTGRIGDPTTPGSSELYLGAGVADVDNDGDLDLYLCDLQRRNKLLLNDGNGYFRNVSDQPNRGVGKDERTNCAIFGDVDNDGDLDLFITNENTTNRLYLNDGNGHFREVTVETGLHSDGGGMGAAFADIDGDGDLDLCVANWLAPNRLYRNELAEKGVLKFVDVTSSTDIGIEPMAKSNAVVFADIDNDGDLDLFITKRRASNRLYINDGAGRFVDRTAEMIGLDSMLSYGASIADFDNDGFQDLYVANVGENVFYRNLGGKRFVNATEEFNAGLGGYSTGTAVGDIDNDGDMDLYVANYIDASSVLYINNLNDSNFVTVQIEGISSNRDAIGACVWLYDEGFLRDRNHLRGYREVSGGCGYGSHNAREVHFGTRADGWFDLLVRFPASGVERTLHHIRAGQRLNLRERDGFEAGITLFGRALRRTALAPETLREFLEFLIVLVPISVSLLFAKRRFPWSTRERLIFYAGVVAVYWVLVWYLQYERWMISTVLPIAFSYTIIGVSHLVMERISLVRRSNFEKLQTRDRIARDLHDDVASTISSTRNYVEALRRLRESLSPREDKLFDKISALLGEAANGVTDIVWTVAPQHDTIGDLLARIRLLISDSAEAQGIKAHVHLDVSDKTRQLPEEVRRNVYLIFKEAIQNASRHSSASLVTLAGSADERRLILEFSDNGKGFSEQAASAERSETHGHGIGNMQRRANEIGATLQVVSLPDKGTTVRLSLQMT